MIDSIRAGAEHASSPYLLDASAAKAYAAALDSPRPSAVRPSNIHNDSDAARRAGFRAPIAAGEQTYALLAQFLADSFGMHFLRGGFLETALIKPVFYGDTLTSHWRAAKVGADFAELEVWVDNDRGECVAAGSARIRA